MTLDGCTCDQLGGVLESGAHRAGCAWGPPRGIEDVPLFDLTPFEEDVEDLDVTLLSAADLDARAGGPVIEAILEVARRFTVAQWRAAAERAAYRPTADACYVLAWLRQGLEDLTPPEDL